MSYTESRIDASQWRGEYPSTSPTTTRASHGAVFVISVTETKNDAQVFDEQERRKLLLSIRGSFFAGWVLCIGMLSGFVLGGFWLGIMFVPPILGCYGLFLSSGMQLDKMNSRIQTNNYLLDVKAAEDDSGWRNMKYA